MMLSKNAKIEVIGKIDDEHVLVKVNKKDIIDEEDMTQMSMRTKELKDITFADLFKNVVIWKQGSE